MLLHEMKKLIEEEAPGPHPSFSLVHALYAILILGERPVGRQKLAARLCIGEGSIRTLLRKLTRRGFVVTDRTGCHLTPKGASLCEEAGKAFHLFEPRSASLPGKARFGVGVRRGGRIARGIPERDQAIKAGADGALVLIYTGGNSSCRASRTSPGSTPTCPRAFLKPWRRRTATPS